MSTFSFSTPQQQSPSLLFPTMQAQAQAQAQQQVHLLTKDKAPVTYHTKWADLHPECQNFLLQIEARILEYRDESRRLDECDRLFNSVALNQGFEVDATRISQELGGISTAMERDKVSLQELMKTAKDLMRNAEVAVRSFVILRPRFSRTVGPALASNSVPTAGTVATSIGIGAPGPTQAVSCSLPVVDFYSGVPIKPSPFLLHTVSRFEHQLQEFRQWVEELERLLFSADTDEIGRDSSQLSLLQSLPLVLTNIHDFFIHVAAKVETLHQQTWSRRTTYLANQRKRGDDNNPFLEADRREVAKKEAAAKRIHPTLQALTTSQFSTQAAGLLSNVTSSSAPSSGPSSTSFLFSGSTPFSAFNAEGSLTSASAPSLSTPSLSLFGSTSAPSPSVFGSSGPSTAPPSLFGSGTTSSIFGSGPAGGTSTSPLSAFSGASAASSSASLFGGTPMPSGGLFGSSTPTLGGQTPGSIFGNPVQPLGSGTGAPAFGIGTTQGATTTKAKTRTTRRK